MVYQEAGIRKGEDFNPQKEPRNDLTRVPKGTYNFLHELYWRHGGGKVVIRMRRSKNRIILQEEVDCEGGLGSCMILGILEQVSEGKSTIFHAHVTEGNKLDSGGVAVIDNNAVDRITQGTFNLPKAMRKVRRIARS